MDLIPQWVPEPESIARLGIKKSTLRLMRNDGRLKPGVHWVNITGTPNGPVSYDLDAIGKTMAERTVQMVQEKAKQLETARKARKAAVEIYGDDAMDQLIADVRN